MSIKTDEKESLWFADFDNNLVGGILRKRLTYAQHCKFFSELKHYFWDEQYLFKACPDGMIRRCVHSSETQKILAECHHGPTGGHYEPSITANKVFDVGFYWPTIFKEAQTLVLNCDACQHSGSISRRDKMPLNSIQPYKTPDGTTSYWTYLVEKPAKLTFKIEHRATGPCEATIPDLKLAGRKNEFYSLSSRDELRLPSIMEKKKNLQHYKARTKAYHDKKLRVRKEFKAGDKVLLYNSKYKFKAPKARLKCFIVNGHRVKLYHDEEQLNELNIEEIHLMCEEGRMKAIPFMAPFPANYRETSHGK
ncbi:reverse transcriptase domain-containing protein [Tanacetum coccineum]